MSDSDDDLDALVKQAASSRPAASTKKTGPLAQVVAGGRAGQAQVERAILGKRGGGGVDLEALLKGAKKRDLQREANEYELERAREVNEAEAAASDVAPMAAGAAPEEAAPVAAAAPTGVKEAATETAVTRAIFVRDPLPLTIRPLSGAESTDSMLAMLAGSNEPAAMQLVEGGWLQAHFAHRPCPAAIQRWLFALVGYHPSPATSAGAARALASLLDGVSQPEWVPSPAHFLRALSHLGADLAVLGESLLDDQGALPQETDAAAAAKPSKPSKRGGKKAADEASAAPSTRPLSDVRHNLLHLLELPASCARHWQRALPGSAQQGAARWVWRLMLEPHAAPAFLLLQDALGRLLDGAPEAAWQAEWLPWAGAALQQLHGLADESLVQLCQWLPPTLRGQRLQRRAAHAAIEQLLARRRGADADAEGGDAEEDEEEEEKGSPAALGRLLARIDARAWAAHMSSLHSVLLLLDLALSSDAPSHRASPTSLTQLSRQMHALKQKVSAAKGALDYHALEVENFLTFLPSKLTHLYGLGS